MAVKSRIDAWTLLRVLVVPCLFLCAIFKPPHIPMDRLRCAFCLGVFRDLEAISLAQKTLQKDARRAKGLSCEAGDQTAYGDSSRSR